MMRNIHPCPFLIVFLIGINWETVYAQPVSVTGSDGVAISITGTSRIVTLGNSITEIVYALGAGKQIVGVDESSVFPAEVRQKPRVGYFRQTSSEGILSLKPSLVISTEGLGPPPVAGQLRAARVPVLVLDEAHSKEEAFARIRTLARVLNQQEAGERLVAEINRDLSKAAGIFESAGKHPGVLFIYARGAGVVNVAGRNTAADAVVRLSGGRNVVSSYEGYRPLTAEAAVAAAPEVIVIPTGSLQSLGGVDGLLRQPGLAATPAGQNRRVVAIDDALLLSFGPRLGKGVLELAQNLYHRQEGTR